MPSDRIEEVDELYPSYDHVAALYATNFTNGSKPRRPFPSKAQASSGRGGANADDRLTRFPFNCPPTDYEKLPLHVRDKLKEHGKITGPQDPKWLTKVGDCVACGGPHTVRWCPAVWAQCPDVIAERGEDYAKIRAERFLWNRSPPIALALMAERLNVAACASPPRVPEELCALSQEAGFSSTLSDYPALEQAYHSRTYDHGRSFLHVVETLDRAADLPTFRKGVAGGASQ